MGKRGSPGQKKRHAPPASTRTSGRPGFAPSLKISFLLLAVVSFAAYFNAVHDTVIWDDRVFLVDTGFRYVSLADFPDFFTESLWEAAGNTTVLYRPLLLVTLGLQSLVFGGWWTGYHLVTVLAHVLATLLVYGFVREFLYSTGETEGKNSPVPLVAAMVFGVHPVLSDAINSVFNGSEIYASIGVLTSLLYLLRTRGKPWIVRWLVVSALFLVSLMYRESAVALPALAVLTLWMSSNEAWRKRVSECLPVVILVVPLAVYFGLRDLSMSPKASKKTAPAPAALAETGGRKADSDGGPPESESAGPAESPLSALGLRINPEKVADVIPMWFDALRLAVWPDPLVIVRHVSLSPVWLASLTQLLLLAIALALAWRGHTVFLTGLLFFYLAILPSSRIISESEQAPVLLERMLYLPLTGLVLVLAGGLATLTKRFSSRASVVTGLVVVLLMTPMTWVRSEDWSDELRLFEGDYAKTGHSLIFASILRAQMRQQKLDEAGAACDAYDRNHSSSDIAIWSCAKVYLLQRKFHLAEPLLLRTISKTPNSAWKRLDLAILYARSGRREEARTAFDEARARERLPFVREIMFALELMELYPHDRERLQEARRHLERALEIQPRATQARDLIAQLNKRL